MVEHRGMANHADAKIRELELTCSDVVAQTASQSFDISVWQFLAVLLVGGKVRIFSDEDARNPSRLLDQATRTGITVLEIVPSMLRALLQEVGRRGPDRHDLASLRWLILTGEALPPELCQAWLRCYPHTRLLNAYGPTECSDDVTHQVIDEPPDSEWTRVPIGRPIMNMQQYVLSARQRLAPIGVVGELHTGGVGVGRGYLREPEWTAEAFVPDPFAAEPGRRLYKSGDLCRCRADGTIEFVGRCDQQMKVRGYRIEAGDVERALCQYPAVRDSMVITRTDSFQQDYLVAYVVPTPRQTPTTQELRNCVRDLLPAYMIPSMFVLLDALPLNANGKRDRSALPDPTDASPQTEEPVIAPRSPMEESLARIWTEVLGREPVHVHANFFELGGHSLLAIQVISRVRDMFGVELPVRVVFDEPTIAGLVVAIAERQSRPCEEAPPIVRIKRGAAEELLKAMDRLSDDEVEALLRNRADWTTSRRTGSTTM